ncbi:hypothetical protein C3K47_18710 [Solitalea longa]|uniref:Uncharacterized protein n=1 Tax=Solitalea longa TaxID=2079460 RepID=A0A2S4ZWU9_9SPHI|nr:hypothetical protein [Solitalea longa]POY34766.1 hypothetical protein C3K47_18710 [Solitalea longa]
MNHQDIRSYFEAEKSATFIIMIIGLLAVITAIVFFFLKTKLFVGTAIPLLVFGAIEVAIGYTVYAQTDKQTSDVIYSFDMNPDYLKNKELPRIQKVNSNFKVIMYVEIGLLLLSLVLVWLNYSKQNFWLGIGLGLLLQGLILFVFDQIAERRARIYTEKLTQFTARF